MLEPERGRATTPPKQALIWPDARRFASDLAEPKPV